MFYDTLDGLVLDINTSFWIFHNILTDVMHELIYQNIYIRYLPVLEVIYRNYLPNNSFK